MRSSSKMCLSNLEARRFHQLPSDFPETVLWGRGSLVVPDSSTPWQERGKRKPQRVSRVVFKWLSKVITWLRSLRLVVGLKDSRQTHFNQWESKPKPIAPSTRDFSRASSELHVIARNCDWFIALPAPVVLGRSNCLGFGFSTVIWKPVYETLTQNLVISI